MFIFMIFQKLLKLKIYINNLFYFINLFSHWSMWGDHSLGVTVRPSTTFRTWHVCRSHPNGRWTDARGMLAITAAWNSDTSHPSIELGARHQPIYPIVFKIFKVFKMDIGLDPLPELSDLKTCYGRNNSLNQGKGTTSKLRPQAGGNVKRPPG